MSAVAIYGFVLGVSVATPAVHRWWGTRALRRRCDDATLPERLLQRSVRESHVLVAACVGLGFCLASLGLATAIAAGGMMLLLRAAAGFQLRRTLFNETWSFTAFAAFHTRMGLAIAGFWFALILAPAVVAAAGGVVGRLAAGACVAAGLLLWSAGFHAVVRRLTRARPMDRSDITDGFMQLIRRTGLALPRLERVDVGGGVFANALALPARSHATVLVSSTLIERLETREVLAICAHEIAHLEQFTPGRLRAMARLQLALVAAATFGVPWMQSIAAGGWGPALFVLWPAAVAVVIDRQSRGRRAHETASDLRAVELTGDPEALVRALTRLHEIARLPRRWDPAFERRATHPSLARRIQAIRAATRHPETRDAVDGPPLEIRSRREGAGAVFRTTHLEWRESPATSHCLEYCALTSLRVHVGADGTLLVATDDAGLERRLPLADADVASVQAALDDVDGRLGVAAAQTSALRSRIASVLG